MVALVVGIGSAIASSVQAKGASQMSVESKSSQAQAGPVAEGNDTELQRADSQGPSDQQKPGAALEHDSDQAQASQQPSAQQQQGKKSIWQTLSNLVVVRGSSY